MRCFEHPVAYKSVAELKTNLFLEKISKNGKLTWTWVFVLKSGRGNALHMAEWVSPAICCAVGSQLQFFRIKLLLQKFLKGVLKVSMCSCAVLNEAFAAQRGCWAGGPVELFTLDQQMWLPKAQEVGECLVTQRSSDTPAIYSLV